MFFQSIKNEKNNYDNYYRRHFDVIKEIDLTNMQNLIALVLFIAGIYFMIKAFFSILTIVLIFIAAYLFLSNKKPIRFFFKKIFKKKYNKK